MHIATIGENNSFQYSATLLDKAGTPIPLTSIVSAELTLYDAETLAIINGRDSQDVLNNNDVTIDPALGTLIWEGRAEDTPVLSEVIAPGGVERHIALFEVVYNLGDETLNHEVHFDIQQSAKLP